MDSAVLVLIGFSAAVAGRPEQQGGSDDPEDKPKSQSPTVITPMIYFTRPKVIRFQTSEN